MDAGCATLGPSETAAVFLDWLARDFAAGMDFLRKHAALREDPRRFAPGTVSVIVALARYPSRKMNPFYSACAQGRDYHDVIRSRLEMLAARIEKKAGRPLQFRIGVDSVPVSEREWAVRAGLGWRGKQGCLVHPDAGCCVLLGELFLDLLLSVPRRMENRCGTCRRCLDACPTGALQENGLVDARRCLSYLTIEHRGDIPAALRPFLKDSLFGCDRCTEVCPWNEKGESLVLSEFHEGVERRPSPRECLALTSSEFSAIFSGTAIRRTGLARLRRNAEILLANNGAHDGHP